MTAPAHYDVLVIGAGFGGLATALTLADAGARVVACETLRYPGGCASTFSRAGYRFESGATLFAGFDPGQLFADWIARYELDVQTRAIDPVIELRTPAGVLAVPPDRERFVEQICALPGAPSARVRAFFAQQRRVADALWALFDEPAMLPPFGARELARHAARAGRYLPLATLLGRPLRAALLAHGLADFAPLKTYLDAVCQITVQTSSDEAEAPFAMGAMDYYFRGARHVEGGIGRLAHALASVVIRRGGEMRFADPVRGLERMRDGGWRARARRGEIRARTVVANLLPANVRALTDLSADAHRRLDALDRGLSEGWGAAMLYLAVDDHAALRREAHHLELVQDPSRPFTEGNHLFVSISAADEHDRAPAGQRTVTVSTHVPLAALRARDASQQGEYVAAVQAAMRAGLARLAPELHARVCFELTASPRTFARFTGRAEGCVGGVPRRAGLQNYRGMIPAPIAPGLYLVGDTVFPGQSTLATALGGYKLARHILGQRASRA